jgi:hypothetical protein
MTEAESFYDFDIFRRARLAEALPQIRYSIMHNRRLARVQKPDPPF